MLLYVKKKDCFGTSATTVRRFSARARSYYKVTGKNRDQQLTGIGIASCSLEGVFRFVVCMVWYGMIQEEGVMTSLKLNSKQ